MRKIILFLFFTYFSVQVKSQSIADYQYDTTPFSISKCVDKVDGSKWYSGSKYLLGVNENETSAFMVSPMFKEDRKGQVIFNGFSVVSVGLVDCTDEFSSLLLVFEDGSRIMIFSTSKFNCENLSILNPGGTEIIEGKNPYGKYKKWEEFSFKKIKTMRWTERRSNKTITYNLIEEEQSFLIEVNNALKNPINEKDCTK